MSIDSSSVGNDETYQPFINALSRRELLSRAAQSSVALACMNLLAGCSGPDSTDPSLHKHNANTATGAVPLDSVEEHECMIGRHCLVTLVSPDGEQVECEFTFEDIATLNIDGDTHSLENIDIGGKSVTLSDSVPVLDVPASDLISHIERDSESGDVLLVSEFGEVAISRSDFVDMLSALRFPKEGKEAEQDISVPIAVELSCGTKMTIGGAVMMGVVKRSDVKIPSSCTISVASKRIPRETEPKKPAKTERSDSSQGGIGDWLRGFQRRITEGLTEHK